MGFFKRFILPTSILAGTIIGAGIFSLPYVFESSGVGLGFLFLILFTFVYCIIHLMYADLVIKNGDEHRFAGLAGIYFGRWGYWLSVLMTIIEMFFVLTIYLVLSSSFISLVFPKIPQAFQVIIFWWIGSVVVFSGTKRVAFFEFLSVAGIIGAIAIIAYFGAPGFLQKSISFAGISPFLWLLPFGPLLFALSGRPAIPLLIHYFNRNLIDPIKSKKAIIWGTAIPAIIYFIFITGVIGASITVTPDSITGFVASVSFGYIVLALAVLGALSLFSSYFSIGLDVFRSLELDIKLSRRFSMFLVILLPLFIYFANPASFTNMVEISGGIFIGLEGIIILSMWKKMVKKEKEGGILLKKISTPLAYGLYGVFGMSILYVLISNLV